MTARKWVVLSNTTIGVLMASIDGSIVLISLPTIGRELPGTGPAALLWVVLTYNLVTTTLLLSFGRFSDMLGRARLYTAGFATFTIGSALASFSQFGGELLAARVIQGIGAGLIWSNSAALLTDAFPEGERGKALGINQVAALSGGVVGLVLGGILTTTLGWRSIFYVNIPIGLFGTVWAYIALEETRPTTSRMAIDWWGNLTFGAGLTAVLVGFTLGSLDGWNTVWPIVIVLGGAVLAAFLYLERIVPHPMFDLSLFRIRTFVAGNLAAGLSALARGAFTFMMVFYLQGVLGVTPLAAGVLLLPLSLAFIVAGPLSGYLSDTRGARALGTVGLIVSSIGFLVLIRFPAYGPYDVLASAMVLLGVGQGMFGAPNRAEVMSSVPSERRGVASGIGTTFLNAGNLGSLALAFSVLAGVVPRSTLSAVFSDESIGAPIDTSAFMAALHLLFVVGLALTVSAAILNALRGSGGVPGPPTAHRGSPSARPRVWTAGPAPGSRVQDETSASK